MATNKKKSSGSKVISGKTSKTTTTTTAAKSSMSTRATTAANQARAEEHLPPLPLVFVIVICSGFIWLLGTRDVLSTGKVLLGDADIAYLDYTNSFAWFDDSNGWKSRQGGLSAVEHVTTDANDMGGLFVRKIGGFALAGVQLHKIVPMLFHPTEAKWNAGHFRPWMMSSIFGNLCIACFLAIHLEDLSNAGGAHVIPLWMLSALTLETVLMMYYLELQRRQQQSRRNGASSVAQAFPAGKTPQSVPSRIVTRTVLIITTAMTVIAGRDFFLPGQPLTPYIPRDDLYLEWTGALIHSPPDDSAEASDQGLSAPLYAGDKFAHQLMALSVLLLCMYKYVSALFIRLGRDGKYGWVAAKVLWSTASVVGFFLVLLMRLFTPAGQSASFDLRWHLMSVGYESFILGLYAFC